MDRLGVGGAVEGWRQKVDSNASTAPPVGHGGGPSFKPRVGREPGRREAAPHPTAWSACCLRPQGRRLALDSSTALRALGPRWEKALSERSL